MKDDQFIKSENKIKSMMLRVNESEKKKIQDNADKYARGNLSNWLRHAGLNYKPQEKQDERQDDRN